MIGVEIEGTTLQASLGDDSIGPVESRLILLQTT